jgi:hypothetical protein
MALYVSSYRSREETLEDAAHINWAENHVSQISNCDRWEGWKTDIHEGGHPLGSSIAVMHIGRENVDPLEDVPHISPSDNNFFTESWTSQYKGRKLVRIHGELWRDEWVEPADHSPRVRGDELPSLSYFVTDAAGTRCNAEKLKGSGLWLWFRPEVISALSHQRGGEIRWYTRDTGGVTCSPSTSRVHFGVNSIGLVNAFAKDIGRLPQWIQTIWAGFNVGPEGGVSQELLASQAEGRPAKTHAPEQQIARVFDLLNEVAMRKFGFRLFRAHDHFQTLITHVHRFRSVDQESFFALAKDLARLTADAIDSAAIQKFVGPPKGEKWGSLKSLEKLVALKSESNDGRAILGPLVGIYDLRHMDAHLPGSNFEEALALAKVNTNTPFVIQGYQLINSCVTSLHAIANVFDRFPNEPS